MLRRLLISLPFQATVVLALVVLVVAGLRSQESQALLTAFEGASAPYELVVQMRFEPEAFHLAKLQNSGRIVGVEGRTVHVRAVEADQLRKLSWRPWITGLEPFAERDPS